MAEEAKVTLHLDLNTSEAQRKQDNFISQNQNLKANLTLDISQALQNFQSFASQIQSQPVNARLQLDGTESPELSVNFSTEEAAAAFRNFISDIQNQTPVTVLELDTGQAVQSFSDFISQAQNQPVRAELLLDGTETPQAVTALKLETEQAQQSFQNFISEMQNQSAELKLSFDSGQIQSELQNLLNQNVTLDLQFDISQAQNIFSQFASQVNGQILTAILKLDTSQAEAALNQFRNQAENPVLQADSAQTGTAVLHLDTSAAKAEFDDFIADLNSQNPEIQLHLHTDQAEQDLQNIHNQTKQISPLAQRTADDVTRNISSIRNVLTGLAGTIGTIFSVSIIRNFVREAKAAWNIQLEAETKLETILSRNIGATKAQIQATKEWASELQSVGVIGDEVQLSGLQELSTYIENADSLRKMNVVLNDMLAQQYGLNATAESAVTISTMLGKVLQGQTAALSRYGYSFTEAQEKLLKYGTEEQRVATLAAVVEESVGGMNEALASTPAGKLKQLENYLGDIKEEFGRAATNLQTIFLPALQNFADLLNAIALKAIEISETLANLFGVDLSSNFTGAVSAAVTEADDLTESAENTQKVIEDTIDKLGAASFDDFNIIGVQDSDSDEDSASESETEITPVLNPSGLQSGLSEIENQFSERLQNLFQPIQNAWNAYGQPLLDSIRNAGEQIKNLFSEIGQSFAEVWTNGTGEEILNSILKIFTNIYGTIGNIAERFALAWSDGTGTSIIQHIADIFQNVLNTIQNISEATADWSETLDFSPLLDSVDHLLENLEPLTDHIGEGLEWFWKNVLLPIAGFTIENLIPDFLNLLSGAVDVLDASIEALKPFGLWLWDEFIRPLADWTGDIITTGLENLADVLHKIGDWIRENPDSAVFIGGVTAAITGLSLAVTGGTFAAMAGKIAAFAGKLATLNVFTGVLIAGFVSWGYVITELSKNWTDICDVFEDSGGAFGFISGWLEYVREDVEDFFSGFGELGKIWESFWESIGAKCYDIAQFLVGWGEYLYDEFREDGLKSIDGLLGGFLEALSQLDTFLKEKIFRPIVEGFKDLFGIHSPSTVMAELGGFLMDGLYNGVSAGIQKIKEIFDKMRNKIKEVFENLPDWFSEKFDQARENIQNIFRDIGDYFSDRWDDITEIFRYADDWFSEKFDQAKENIQNIFQDIGDYFSDRWDDITEIFLDSDSWFSDKFTEAFEKIRDIFSEAGALFSQIWSAIQSPFAKTADWFREIFSGAWESVKQVFSSGGTVFQGIQTGISDTFRSVVNSLIDGINSVIASPFRSINDLLWSIRYFEIGGWYPFWELPEIGIPEIPHLAKGGLVRQPTLAMIGDNPNAQSDPEIVSPLSKLKNLLPEQNQNRDFMLESKLDTLIQLTEVLISTIEENQPVIRIGDTEIYTASERGRRKFNHMKGVR